MAGPAGSLFSSYRDPETRKAMAEFISQKHGWSMKRAEEELCRMNHVGLAYLRLDMEQGMQEGTR